jgi:hypothetical protein
MDAELAKRLLPGNPGPLSTAAFARLAAASACRWAGRADKADEHLAAAGREADEVARFRGSYDAVDARYCVAVVSDGLDGRMDMLAELRALQSVPDEGLAHKEAYNLFCLGRDTEAAAVASRFPDSREHGHLRVALALGRPNGRADARRTWERITRPDRPAVYRREAAPMLFVVGEPGDRVAAARELRAELLRLGGLTSSTLAEVAILLDFLEGTLSEAELLSRPVNTMVAACRRHYWVAWKRLGAGDRAGAEAAFREAYAVRIVAHQFFWTSRAILIRMKDPAWPAWPAAKR